VTLINRYILTTFIKITSLSLAAFVGIYLLVDFFEKVDDFLEHQAAAQYYFTYFICKTPLIISQVLPLTILMGVFLTLGGLTKSNELTAIRAGGISIFKVITPLLIAATLLSGVNFALNEYLVPAGTRTANHILRTEVKGKTTTLTKRDNVWFRDNDALYHIDLVIAEKKQLHGVTMYQFDQQLQITNRIDAVDAIYRDESWRSTSATVRQFSTTTRQLTAENNSTDLILPLSKTPEDFGTSAGKNDELNFSQLRHLSQRMQQEGLDVTRYRVDMFSRLATPLACLIMAFVAIPFALQKSRNVNLALGISISVLIGVAFFIVQSTLIALGYSGALPPFIAAWSANIIFLLFGLFLILSTRD
jgi:lipopolysaccharide export system permease protein